LAPASADRRQNTVCFPLRIPFLFFFSVIGVVIEWEPKNVIGKKKRWPKES
jgi:hypothetical protein